MAIIEQGLSRAKHRTIPPGEQPDPRVVGHITGTHRPPMGLGYSVTEFRYRGHQGDRGLVDPQGEQLLTIGTEYDRTPADMAAKLVEWAVREPGDKVLDPSFGGLVFLEAATARLRELGADPSTCRDQLWGVDLDAQAMAAASRDDHVSASPRRPSNVHVAAS